MATGTAVDVVMPQMGVSVSEGTITKWNKQVGDTIEADETLLEISTDKVDTEVPSPASGVVTEIIDLRSILPWDKQAVLESVRKTSKVLVLHEDTRTGGFGAEIAATIAEEAFESLDAPVKRIAAPDSPVPFSPPLEKAFIPQVETVASGLRELAAY